MTTSTPMGDRMKAYEKEFDQHLEPGKCYMFRLDGHTFSKYTAPFIKPWDLRIADAMSKTCMDLLQDNHLTSICTAAYTQSDEITLIFAPQETREQLPFSGRVSKLITLASSYCSVRFAYHMSTQQVDPVTEAKILKKSQGFQSHFDCRVFELPNQNEVLNNLVWRCRDAKRNSKNNWARKFFSAKELHKLTSEEMIAKAKAEKGADYHDEPAWFRFGTVFKKTQFTKLALDHQGKEVEATRTKTVCRAADLEFDPAMVQLLLEKYVPAELCGQTPDTFHDWAGIAEEQEQRHVKRT